MSNANSPANGGKPTPSQILDEAMRGLLRVGVPIDDWAPAPVSAEQRELVKQLSLLLQFRGKTPDHSIQNAWRFLQQPALELPEDRLGYSYFKFGKQELQGETDRLQRNATLVARAWINFIDDVELDFWVQLPEPNVIELWTTGYDTALVSRQPLGREKPLTDQLRGLLVRLFQYGRIFLALPRFESAGLLDAKDWEAVIAAVLEATRKKEVSDFKDPHGILAMAAELGITLTHGGGDAVYFTGNCPSGRQHFAFFEPDSGLFKCPWCKFSGGPADLKERKERFRESLKAGKAARERS